MDKHCTQRISYQSLSSLVGPRTQVVQRLAFLIFQMRSRARTGLKSKRKIGNSFQARRRAARGDHLVTILEFGMILRDVAGSSSETAGLCISSNKSAKCQGNFFTVFHMQRGKEEGEKKPHAALRRGRRQTGPPSSDVRAKAPELGTSSCALLWMARSGSRSLCLKQQTLVHLRPPPLRRSPAAGRALGVGLRRWACATAACCPAGWLWLQAASGPVPGLRWAVPPCGTAAGPRCNPGASWPGGRALLGNRQWGCPRSLEVWEAAPGTCLPCVR